MTDILEEFSYKEYKLARYTEDESLWIDTSDVNFFVYDSTNYQDAKSYADKLNQDKNYAGGYFVVEYETKTIVKKV